MADEAPVAIALLPNGHRALLEKSVYVYYPASSLREHTNGRFAATRRAPALPRFQVHSRPASWLIAHAE